MIIKHTVFLVGSTSPDWHGLLTLQVLWLADNYISSIAGLSQLTGLHQLNLARNDITVVGNSLQQNTGLSSLNLADNRVCSMRVSLEVAF